MLNTEKRLAVNQGVLFPQPERRRKVKDGMRAIRVVLGERKREALARRALRILESKKKKDEEAAMANNDSDVEK